MRNYVYLEDLYIEFRLKDNQTNSKSTPKIFDALQKCKRDYHLKNIIVVSTLENEVERLVVNIALKLNINIALYISKNKIMKYKYFIERAYRVQEIEKQEQVDTQPLKVITIE